jgi:hypothetical protein
MGRGARRQDRVAAVSFGKPEASARAPAFAAGDVSPGIHSGSLADASGFHRELTHIARGSHAILGSQRLASRT